MNFCSRSGSELKVFYCSTTMILFWEINCKVGVARETPESINNGKLWNCENVKVIISFQIITNDEWRWKLYLEQEKFKKQNGKVVNKLFMTKAIVVISEFLNNLISVRTPARLPTSTASHENELNSTQTPNNQIPWILHTFKNCRKTRSAFVTAANFPGNHKHSIFQSFWVRLCFIITCIAVAHFPSSRWVRGVQLNGLHLLFLSLELLLLYAALTCRIINRANRRLFMSFCVHSPILHEYGEIVEKR